MYGFIKHIFSFPAKLNALIGMICILTCIIYISGCSNNTDTYPVLNQPITGVLLIRGYKVSGSDNQYWKLNMKNFHFGKLESIKDINKLDIQYFLNIRYNPDEQKIIHQYEFNFKTPVLKYIKRYVPGFLKNTIFEDIPFIKEENIQSPSKNTSMTVNIDYNKHQLILLDNQQNVLKKIVFKNYIFFPVLSPDSKYIALFEHQPYFFSDGSVYKIRLINVKTGTVYSFKNDDVSLPGSMLWVQK